MTQDTYRRRTGDMEIRVLRDSRVVFLAPDEDLADLAEFLQPDHPDLMRRKKRRRSNAESHGRT